MERGTREIRDKREVRERDLSLVVYRYIVLLSLSFSVPLSRSRNLFYGSPSRPRYRSLYLSIYLTREKKQEIGEKTEERREKKEDSTME